MKYSLAALLFLGLANFALAYELKVTEVARPYDMVPVDFSSDKQSVYLGELDEFPVMYRVSLQDSDVLELGLRQKYSEQLEPLPLSLLVVKENKDGRGVSEVLRFSPKDEDWSRIKDSKLGMTFLDSEFVTKEVEAGVYRIEISTPTNKDAKYALFFGDTAQSAGYFESLRQARVTQEFFGYSFIKMIGSSLVYYPLGIIFIALLFRKIYKCCKPVKHAD